MVGHPFTKMYNQQNQVLAISTNRRISLKDAREIGAYIKGKNVHQAIRYLNLVVKQKAPIPYKRYTEGAAHKPGQKYAGRYPVNAAKEILKVLNSLIKNAEYKGLDTENLIIKGFAVSHGVRFYRPRRSRFRGQKIKSTNVYILGEVKA